MALNGWQKFGQAGGFSIQTGENYSLARQNKSENFVLVKCLCPSLINNAISMISSVPLKGRTLYTHCKIDPSPNAAKQLYYTHTNYMVVC